MKIYDFIPFSLVDYPNRLSSVIFLPYCNFRCVYCYNYELFNPDESKLLTEDIVLEKIKKQKDLIDSTVVTGGEPTLHSDLIDFLKKLKNLNLNVKLDTNGENFEMLQQIIKQKLIDYIAMDIKTSFNNYDFITGKKVNKENIKKTINLILNSNINYEFRTTIVPKYVKEKQIKDICKLIKGAKLYAFQQFKNTKVYDIKLKNIKPYSLEKLKYFKKISSKFVKNIIFRNMEV